MTGKYAFSIDDLIIFAGNTNMKFSNVMIDFETLATVPHAVVLQLGWAFFQADPAPERHRMETGQVLFSVPHQVKQRRELNIDTWNWWLRQEPTLFRKLLEGTFSIPEALAKFDEAWKMFADFDCKIWGNGANFDEPIMSNLYRTNGMKMPGHFSASRCVRTIKAICPLVPYVKSTTLHDGESDAIAQAQFVQNCYDFLHGGRSETAAQILAREKNA